MFVTVWYAGVVVLSIGFNGMTLDKCKEISEVVRSDIVYSYQTPESRDKLLEDGFVMEKWNVTCELKQLK